MNLSVMEKKEKQFPIMQKSSETVSILSLKVVLHEKEYLGVCCYPYIKKGIMWSPCARVLSKSTDIVCSFSCPVLVGLSSRLFGAHKPVLLPPNVLYLSVMPSLK